MVGMGLRGVPGGVPAGARGASGCAYLRGGIPHGADLWRTHTQGGGFSGRTLISHGRHEGAWTCCLRESGGSRVATHPRSRRVEQVAEEAPGARAGRHAWYGG